MTRAHIEYDKAPVPEVYTSIAKVLKALKVEKNGTLPGNMGGKAYITAVDISQEIKRQFVENDLIFIPNEEVVRHENIQNNNRLQVSIVIKGTYTITSTADGSSVTISGTGDGLATGTAVASNIASTNALKNALLRTFLITEQSVEDDAKNGPAETPTNRKLDKARTTPSSPSRLPAGGGTDLKARIKAAIDAGKVDKDVVNKTWDDLTKETGKPKAEVLPLVIEKLGIA